MCTKLINVFTLSLFILSRVCSSSPVEMLSDCVRLTASIDVTPVRAAWLKRDNSCTALAQLAPAGASLNLRTFHSTH